RLVDGLFPPKVSHSAPPILLSITIQDFFPITASWNSDSVLESRDRRKVADNDQSIIGGFSVAQEREHARSGVIAINPLKTRRIRIQFKHCSLAPIHCIQGFDPLLYASMKRAVRQVPVQLGVVGPLAPLRELPSHKKKFLPGLCVHISKQ